MGSFEGRLGGWSAGWLFGRSFACPVCGTIVSTAVEEAIDHYRVHHPTLTASAVIVLVFGALWVMFGRR